MTGTSPPLRIEVRLVSFFFVQHYPYKSILKPCDGTRCRKACIDAKVYHTRTFFAKEIPAELGGDVFSFTGESPSHLKPLIGFGLYYPVCG